MRKGIKRLIWGVAALLLVAMALLVAMLETARVELTADGVDRRLLLPLPGVGRIAVPLYALGDGHVRIAGHLDGPVVRMQADGRWQASWFCEDRAVRRNGTGDVLSLTCAGHRRDLLLRQPAPAGDDLAMPAQVAVLSDIEGDDTYLQGTLRRLAVVDDKGDWAYGRGYLVVLGDVVDRGPDVSGVLWRLHQLALQAQQAGGAVRLVLGNHDQYALRGNFSRANPRHVYAMGALGGYAQAYGADTLLGQWLHAQPVALRLGRTLFVHGGISPQVASGPNDLAALNRRMREYWQAPRAGDPAFEPVLGFSGLTQYRGLVEALEDKYPRATPAEVERALARFDVDRIVVAHTHVPRVASLYDGRVLAVNTVRPEALRFEEGRPHIVQTGIGRGDEPKPASRARAFSLSSARDRTLLATAYRQMRRLSALPHPY